MKSQETMRQAFFEWLTAARSHKASYRDRCFIDANGQEFPTAYLMGLVSDSTATLPAEYAWIIVDYPEFIGRNALQTYENAVRVVRAHRRQ